MESNQNNLLKRRTDRIFVFLVVLACFFSNISQLPFLVSTGTTQKVNMPIWIILLLYISLKKRIKIFSSTFWIIVATAVGVAILLFFMVITDNTYFTSSLLQSLIISLFIYFLGTFVGGNFTDKDLKLISFSYVLSATIVTFSIFIEYFLVGFDITSRQYAYSSKNSISQIIFTAIVILMFSQIHKHKMLIGIKLFLVFFELMLLILLKSRATIVGFAICIIYIIIGKEFNRKLKFILSSSVLISTIYLLLNEKVLRMFINNILFAGRDVSSLDSLTSGRVSIITEFPRLIEGHWLTGIGSRYFECFPLSCILQFGIIVGCIIIVIAYLPIVKSLKFSRTNIYNSIFTVICIGYGINSIFEGVAPIGPGVKCYFMWLMYGILRARQINKKDMLKRES